MKNLRTDAIDQHLIERAKARQNRKGLRRKPPRWLDPASIERQYQSELTRLVNEFFEYVDGVLSGALDLAVQERNIETAMLGVRIDAWTDNIQRAVQSIALEGGILTAKARDIALSVGVRVSGFNDQQSRKIMRSTLGVDVFRDEPWLRSEIESWVAENVALIKSIPDQALTSIEGAALRGVRSGASAQDIAKEIREKFKTTKSRARLIARDQVGKLNADLTQKRQKSLGVDLYVWRTSGDERVRESHKKINGKTCRWDDPSVYSNDGGKTWQKRSSIGGFNGHPGYDFQCRCSAEPVLSKLFEELGI